MTDPLWINSSKASTATGTATIAAATDLLTIAGHGLVDGDTVTVDTLTGGAVGVLVVDGVYFVRDSLTNTFALTLTLGGAPVQFSADGGAAVYRWAPGYNAQELRQSMAAWLYPGVAAEHGARAGVRPHSVDPISVAGTTWTVHDLAAVVAGAGSGPYAVGLPEQSGSLNPADGSNPRIDALDLQIQDDDEDASGEKRARVVYAPGTPASSPSAPALTVNSLRLGTILVPATGVPSPSVATLASFSAASGGVLILRDGETQPATGVREGMYLDQNDALQRRGASSWVPVASPNAPLQVIFTSSGTFTKADFPWAHRWRARVLGGGGAGGGSAATTASEGSVGNGGGAGGYAEGWGDMATLAANETVTVGVGGTGASGASGSNGGSSSFGALVVVTGGAGGSVTTATNDFVVVGNANGGVGTAGQVQGAGANSQLTVCLHSLGNLALRGGDGGTSSPYGQEGEGGRGAGGSNAVGFASGGGGASGGHSAVARTGGAGGPGLVIIELF